MHEHNDGDEGADVRARTLQRLLDESRDRQADLTAELIRSRSVNARLESESSRLGILEVQLSASQSEAQSASARASVAARRIAVLEAQLSAASGLADRLRDRVGELEQDLRAMGGAAAEAATAKAQLERLQVERDAARARAEDERSHAASDRLQATKFERQLGAVQLRCGELEARIEELLEGQPGGSEDRPAWERDEQERRTFTFPTDHTPSEPAGTDRSVIDVRDETDKGGFSYGSGGGTRQG